MNVTLSDEKAEVIDKVAERYGFRNFDIEVKSGSMKGDGYLGIIHTVHIQDGHKTDKELNLIMKSATEGELRQHAPVRKAYEREIFMYEDVFPLLRKFSEETGIRNKFTETAKCYGSLLIERQECLILENLKQLDYKLWNRKFPMDSDHAAIVFKTYAKFHGTCLAFKHLHPEKFEKLCGNLKSVFDEPEEEENEVQTQKFTDTVKHVFSNGMKAVEGNEKATQALARFEENSFHFFKKELKEFQKNVCILHGDCWCNNMLFRYQDPNAPSRPSEVCLLDWQLATIGSPICDLSYFFYACSSNEVLHDLEKFLQIYHENVSRIVEEAGLDPAQVLTYEELKNEWKLLSKFGLFMAIFIMKVNVSEVEEVPDLDDLLKKGKELVEILTTTECVNFDAGNKRVRDVIVFMLEKGFL